MFVVLFFLLMASSALLVISAVLVKADGPSLKGLNPTCQVFDLPLPVLGHVPLRLSGGECLLLFCLEFFNFLVSGRELWPDVLKLLVGLLEVILHLFQFLVAHAVIISYLAIWVCQDLAKPLGDVIGFNEVLLGPIVLGPQGLGDVLLHGDRLS